MDVLVVKVGGSLVSDKSTPGHLDEQAVAGYAERVADLYRAAPGRVVLVAGGGAIGHGAVRHRDPGDPLAALPLTWATFAVKWAWVRALRLRRVPCLPVQVAAICTVADGRLEVCREVLAGMLGHGLLPVLSGDCVLGADGALHVLGSDHVPGVVLRSHPGRVRVAVLTDVPGVLTGPDRRDVLAEVRPDAAAEAFRHIWPAPAHDTSGSMAGKVTALLDHARHGAECFVLRGDRTTDLRFLLRPRPEWPAAVRYTRIAVGRDAPRASAGRPRPPRPAG